MNLLRRHSLRWQLTASYLLLVGLTVAVLGFVTLQVTRRTFDAFVAETSRRKAEGLAVLLAAYYEGQGGSWEGLQEVVATMTRRPGDARPLLRRRPFLPLAQYLPLPGDRVLVAGPDGKVVADTDRTSSLERLSESMLARGTPIVVDGRQVGTVLVGANLGVLNAAERAYLRQLNRALLLVLLLVGGVALLLGAWLARRITEPVRALTAAAKRLAEGGVVDATGRTYDPLPVRSSDELGQMSEAFNVMAGQLDQQARLRRQLVADIAHELRTPLSVMRLELEALEDGLQSPGDATASLRAEIDLVTQLIEDLRLLAQNDTGEQPLELERTDVGGLVEGIVTRWRARAAAAGLSLRTVVAGALSPAWIDRVRITRVLTNLLANALRHTPAGGEIVVGVEARPGELLVSVHDTGEGIPPQELENIFERFYRLDRARSRATGGSGLGLAIARQAIELHGGRMWAESTGVPGDGTTVYFTLPLDPRQISASARR